MSSLHGAKGREDKNEESAEHSTMHAESEDVVEGSLDEIDEEGMTQPVPKLVRVFYHVCGDYSKALVVCFLSASFSPLA